MKKKCRKGAEEVKVTKKSFNVLLISGPEVMIRERLEQTDFFWRVGVCRFFSVTRRYRSDVG